MKKLEKEYGLERTLNKMGHSTKNPTEYIQYFLEYVKFHPGTFLDIGAAFGVATVPAIESGSSVIANDLDPQHLKVIRSKVSPESQHRLKVICAPFPGGMDLEENSLDGVLASQILHFLSGEDLENGFKKVFKWLKPGGKFFTVSCTPYMKGYKSLIPTFLKRKKLGQKWPGFFSGLSETKEFWRVRHLPDHLHFFDDVVLRSALEEYGFEVERCEMYLRANLPKDIAYDGRENVGAVACKPL